MAGLSMLATYAAGVCDLGLLGDPWSAYPSMPGHYHPRAQADAAQRTVRRKARGGQQRSLPCCVRVITYQGWRARSGQRRRAQGVLVSPHDPAVTRTVRERPFALHRPCHVAGIALQGPDVRERARSRKRAQRGAAACYPHAVRPPRSLSHGLWPAHTHTLADRSAPARRCVSARAASEAALYRPEDPAPHRGGASTLCAAARGHGPYRHC